MAGISGPVFFETDLDLHFSLQYPHFIKRDGNRLVNDSIFSYYSCFRLFVFDDERSKSREDYDRTNALQYFFCFVLSSAYLPRINDDWNSYALQSTFVLLLTFWLDNRKKGQINRLFISNGYSYAHIFQTACFLRESELLWILNSS